MPSSSPQQTRDDYILSRDYKATTRLNYQHWLMKQLFGYLIHPSILVDHDHPRIADIGSGTCIWPIEVSRALPSATVHAFDISPSQYPPQEWLPSNVTCYIHDAFEPFPEEHLEKYDVVHVRFFITVAKARDPSSLIRNLKTLLKPNGYLQWIEGDPPSSSVVAVGPSTVTEATQAMLNIHKKPRTESSFGWPAQLPYMFAQQTLDTIVFDRYPILDEYRAFWNQTHLMLYEEYISRLEEENREDLVVRDGWMKRREEIPRVYEEFRSGVSIHADLLCVVGRKSTYQKRE